MEYTKIVTMYHCSRCGHEWIPKKKKKPTVCAKCNNPNWDSPIITREKLEAQTDRDLEKMSNDIEEILTKRINNLSKASAKAKAQVVQKR